MLQYKSQSTQAHPARIFIVCGRSRSIEEVKALFEACGKIVHSHLARDRSNNSRGFAFVQYERAEDAWKAIDRFDGHRLSDGHVLRVSIAKVVRTQREAKQKVRIRNDVSFAYRNGCSLSLRHEATNENYKLKQPQNLTTQSNMSLEAKRTDAVCDKNSSSRFSDTGNKCREVATLPNPGRLVHRQTYEDGDAQRRKLQKVGAEDVDDRLIPAIVNSVITKMLMTLEHVESQALHQQLDSITLHSLMSYYRSQSNTYLEQFDAVLSRLSCKGAEGQSRDSSDSDCIEREIGDVSDVHQDVLSSFIQSVTLNAEANLPSSNHGRTRSSCMFPATIQSNKRIKHEVASTSSSIKPNDAGTGIVTRGRTRNEHGKNLTGALECSGKTFEKPIDREYSASNGLTKSRRRVASQRKGEHDDNQNQNNCSEYAKPFRPEARVHKQNDHISRSKGFKASTLLFATSDTFTTQELYILFGAYGEVLSISRSKTFGKVKTMANITFSKVSEAQSVMDWFQNDENSRLQGRGRTDVEGSILRLSYINDNSGRSEHISEPDSKQHPVSVLDRLAAGLVQDKRDAVWVLVLYNPRLPEYIVSSRIAENEKLEHVDVRVTKSSNGTQGVAFAKFQDGTASVNAARTLHLTQIQTNDGSVYMLQAVVVADPALFDANFKGTSNGTGAEQCCKMRDDDTCSGDRVKVEDDIVAVETQFAHLMRTSHSDRNCSTVVRFSASENDNLLTNTVQCYDDGMHAHDWNMPSHPLLPALNHSVAYHPAPMYPTTCMMPNMYVPPFCGYYDPYYHNEPIYMSSNDIDTSTNTTRSPTSKTSVLVHCCESLQLTTIAALVENYDVLTLTKKSIPSADLAGNENCHTAFLIEFADSNTAKEAAEELSQGTCCGEPLRTEFLEKPFDLMCVSALARRLSGRRSKRQKLEPRERSR